jgi:hypothetical protein
VEEAQDLAGKPTRLAFRRFAVPDEVVPLSETSVFQAEKYRWLDAEDLRGTACLICPRLRKRSTRWNAGVRLYASRTVCGDSEVHNGPFSRVASEHRRDREFIIRMCKDG